MRSASKRLFAVVMAIMLATSVWQPQEAVAHGGWPWVVPHLTAVVEGDIVTYSILLENRNSHSVKELEIIGKVPHGVTFIDSWAGNKGTNRGVFTGGEVKWSNSSTAGNGNLGPFVFVTKVNPARSAHPHLTIASKAYVRWSFSVPGDAVDFLTIANPLEANELKVEMASTGHWHVTRDKNLTFTVTNDKGQSLSGLSPEVYVKTLSGKLDVLKAVDNGDGTYTANYTASEIGSGYETGYSLLFSVEQGGIRNFEAWPVEVVRDGNEGIMPVVGGTKYAYQVRYGFVPGAAKAGDEVSLVFEPRRAIQTGDDLNTKQPFRNTFNHLGDLKDAKIVVEKDGQVVQEITPTFSGLGIYSAKHKFALPGKYAVSLLFTDPANGFSIDKSQTSYPLQVSATGQSAATKTDGVQITLASPGHWHATRAKNLTFTVADSAGKPLSGLKPEVTVKTLSGKTDTMTPVDNGDGTYTAKYTAWEIGSAYSTFYTIALTVEKDGVRYGEAWPVEVVRDGNEGIVPVMGGTRYAYQVRYGFVPGVAKVGDEVNLVFEPRRAIQTGDDLNTAQPFRNTFKHLRDLRDAKIVVEKDGQVVQEITPNYSGLGIYSAKHKFASPGKYAVSLLFTDPANGFSIDKSETSYPLLVNTAGKAEEDSAAAAPAAAAPAPSHAAPSSMPPMVASLDQITYDPQVSQAVLLSGKRAFENACASCHALPTTAKIKAFGSDQQMVNFTIGMTNVAGVANADAERLIRYMLAVRYDKAP